MAAVISDEPHQFWHLADERRLRPAPPDPAKPESDDSAKPAQDPGAATAAEQARARADAQRLASLRQHQQRLESRLADLEPDARPPAAGSMRADRIRLLNAALRTVQRQITELASRVPADTEPAPALAAPQPRPDPVAAVLAADNSRGDGPADQLWQRLTQHASAGAPRLASHSRTSGCGRTSL